MEFCPTCGMLLQFRRAGNGRGSRLACPTCPYSYSIERKIVKKQHLVKKQVEPIFSQQDSDKTRQKTSNIMCPKCHGGEAYFTQAQIRSADEPMTIFYQCCNDSCRAQWKED